MLKIFIKMKRARTYMGIWVRHMGYTHEEGYSSEATILQTSAKVV